MKYSDDCKVYRIRYYNVWFYLFAKTEMDEYKINILGERIGMGDSMMMKDIHCWCTRQNIRYDKIVGLKKQQEKENLEIIQREIDAMLRRKERISITALAKYAGVDRSYFYRNLQAKQMVEDAQLKQGECYNPKKAIFDRATEEVNKQLKRQMILYKRRIKELELQIELLEEENQRLKENR